MYWIWVLLVFTILFFLIKSNITKKKKRKQRLLMLKNWGLPKQNEHFDFDRISQFFTNHQNSQKTHQTISDVTWNDLDLDEVFKYIDRTCSKVGQQYLYTQLRTINSIAKLKKFGELTKIFISDEFLRINSQLELHKLSSYKSYYLEELFRPKKAERSNRIWYVYALSGTAFLSVVLSFYYPTISLVLIPIFAINAVLHYRNKNLIQYYLDGVGQLFTSYQVAHKLAGYKEVQNYYSDLGFFKNIKPVLSKARFIEWEKKIDGEFAVIFWFVSELFKITFNLEYILFYNFQSALEKEKATIKKLFLFIGEIDSAISCASLHQNKTDVCEPEFVNDKNVFTKGIYHPLVEKCTPNNLLLEGKSILLTGSNMSGKTTFIRSVSINAILAQTLNLCFAKEYSAPFFKVYSSIRVSDNLMGNTSYYLQEVLRIKDFIVASEDSSPCLFILDELFKGTNTTERIAAGKVILSYLNKANHIVMVSTHDLELTDLLENEGYDLYHLSESIEDDKLVFDHKLKLGKLTSRNAIEILKLYGYPADIIKESKALTSTITTVHNAS